MKSSEAVQLMVEVGVTAGQKLLAGPRRGDKDRPNRRDAALPENLSKETEGGGPKPQMDGGLADRGSGEVGGTLGGCPSSSPRHAKTPRHAGTAG